MLELKKISKIYELDSFKQKALDHVSVNFRHNEFVSILGPSGSGKTTLLNIIGGLDHYTSGDLIINEISTREFRDRDWDSYRNHRIGFVFQSYNLIMHQSILSNVELALTLSGVNKKERRKRAKKALKDVGLERHMNKKPNQLSGGQMQRVAIARALINDPDILLADEPTGALDSETSKQIMKLLSLVAKKKLVIMVTHNPELAEEYSTRIVKLKDGKIIDDSNSYDGGVDTKETLYREMSKSRKTSMSLKTALGLSFNNLMTKKGRTILTSVAGSIGIIGIALILSLSSGVNNYIDRVQEETLTSYPLTIESSSVDLSSFMDNNDNNKNSKNKDKNKIYSNDTIGDTLEIMSSKVKSNNLKDFKKYLTDNEGEFEKYTTAISYSYDLDLQLFKSDTSNGVVQVNPDTVISNMGMSTGGSSTSFSMGNVFNELFDNDSINDKMYQVVSGRMPNKYNEVVVLVDENNRITDYVLYAIGLKDQKELKELYQKVIDGEKVTSKSVSYDYDEIVGLTYKLLLNTDYYEKKGNIWVDRRDDESYLKEKLESALEIKVVGIIKPNDDVTVSSNQLGGVLYTKELKEYVINKINDEEIIKEQKEKPDVNIRTGMKFSNEEFDFNSLSAEQKMYLQGLAPEELAEIIANYKEMASATYESTLIDLGSVTLDSPKSISIYASSFEDKDEIKRLIEEYNDIQKDNDKDGNIINYNDLVGMLMSSVTSIVNMISYVLIAFVSISLVVSSIMIGIITYISVLERTKEIGILRAVGASRKDVSRVFNAETLIVGFAAGLFGIITTILLNIPINIIIKNIAGVKNLSVLPVGGAIILVIISVVLTMIAGLIPSGMASRKDPVESLRSE